jgi:hypothetical protein
MQRPAIRLLLSALFTFTLISAAITKDMSEDFEGGFDAWEIYDEPGANSGPSAWDTKQPALDNDGDAFSPLSNIYGGDADAHEPSRGTWAIYANETWSDAIFEVDMMMTDNDVPGLIFRYVDPENFYVFDLMEQGRAIPPFKRLRKVVGGTYTELDIEHDGGYVEQVWYRARLEFSGPNISVFWDDEEVLRATDDESALREGSVALSSWGMTDIWFDNVRVTGTAAVEPAGKAAVTWATIKGG